MNMSGLDVFLGETSVDYDIHHSLQHHGISCVRPQSDEYVHFILNSADSSRQRCQILTSAITAVDDTLVYIKPVTAVIV